MDLAKVRELVKLVEESMIDELEVTSKDQTIRIQKSIIRDQATAVFAAPAPTLPVQTMSTVTPPAAEAPPTDPARAKWRDVRSPIVGTFYSSPSPDTDPFVRIGDRVVTGQTLCIIEAMKVMNEIEAEFGGVIKEILAEDSSPIEAEAVLYLIDPS